MHSTIIPMMGPHSDAQMARSLWDGGLFKGGVFVVRLRGKSSPLDVIYAFMLALGNIDQKHALQLFQAHVRAAPTTAAPCKRLGNRERPRRKISSAPAVLKGAQTPSALSGAYLFNRKPTLQCQLCCQSKLHDTEFRCECSIH